jgi:hypothetical protein
MKEEGMELKYWEVLDKMSREQSDWFLERLTEGRTGRIIVKSHLVKKWRKISGNYTDDNARIRFAIIDAFQRLY